MPAPDQALRKPPLDSRKLEKGAPKDARAGSKSLIIPAQRLIHGDRGRRPPGRTTILGGNAPRCQ